MIKVAIVEDEQLTRKGLVLTTPWDSLGCKVVGEACNGLEGIQMIKQTKPHIVITDVRMPKMTGIDMLKELEGQKKAEYIIISGYDDFKYAQQAISLGVTEYLLKPVEDDALIQALSKTVSKVKKELEQYEQKKSLSCGLLDFNEYPLEQQEGKKKYVVKAIKYIMSNYFDEFAIKDVAEALYITDSYLSRLFKKETGYTFVDYLTRYRIQKATELLQEEHIKIYQVAELVGFRDSRYFSSIFKKYVGMTPTELREQM